IGDSFDKLPVAGAAPEWMSEKAISIGMYIVASGIFTVVNPALPVQGSSYVEELLTKTFEKHFGATWAFEADPIKAAQLMIDHIDRKRTDLGLAALMYEVPYAPKAVQAAAGAS
ncbi:MAG: carbon monoxide dehydrogenase, partial [Planctomycetes bacterium]|nr:carbon monoxide dehydrogenase [Planctomycetota bacterium]